MPARPPRTRIPLWLTILFLPAAATLALFLISHFWFTWYSSLPENTPVGGPGGAPPHTRIYFHAGILHINNDALLQAASPQPSGTIVLGYTVDSTGRYESGTQFIWAPASPWRDSWQVQWQTGNWRFPLALPLALLLVPPLTARFITRRARANHCTTCNYNRSGLPPLAKCPECGTTAGATP